jgi:undecaprenyl-diphosphatase
MRLERRELMWLLVALGLSTLLFVFIKLASEVMEGDTLAFDTHVLRALRDARDVSKPIGPTWLPGVAMDLTALGSPTVIGLLVFAVTGFLLLQRMYRHALIVLGAAVSAWGLEWLLKAIFGRARPSVVPHLREVFSASFPSGHALESAAVYLTLGAMLMRLAEGRLTKIYCLAMAMLLTLLVGASRVYLGVHYPTDVLAGWIVGLLWASVCWIAARRLERRADVRAEKPHG